MNQVRSRSWISSFPHWLPPSRAQLWSLKFLRKAFQAHYHSWKMVLQWYKDQHTHRIHEIRNLMTAFTLMQNCFFCVLVDSATTRITTSRDRSDPASCEHSDRRGNVSRILCKQTSWGTFFGNSLEALSAIVHRWLGEVNMSASQQHGPINVIRTCINATITQKHPWSSAWDKSGWCILVSPCRISLGSSTTRMIYLASPNLYTIFSSPSKTLSRYYCVPVTRQEKKNCVSLPDLTSRHVGSLHVKSEAEGQCIGHFCKY